MMVYQCDICGERDVIENADFVHIGDAVLCKSCYTKIVKSEAIDEVLEIIDVLDAEVVKDFELDTNYGLALVYEHFAKARKKIAALKGGDGDANR